MRRKTRSPSRKAAIAVALLGLVAALPAWAQDAAPAVPAPSRPASDEPPPLNLGTPTKAQPDPLDSRWRAYAEATNEALKKALAANRKTRTAALNVQFELWVDPKGHVTRVQLVQPTGNAELDATLRNEVLSGLTLPAAPEDMPMPVKGRIQTGHDATAPEKQ